MSLGAKIKPRLVDPHGRFIHKLRVQLTDTCNFRCFYCMPAYAEFLPSSALLTAEEIIDICTGLNELGIDEMRLSGGEPTLRKDFDEIVDGLSSLPLARLGVTTNGYFLDKKLSFLKGTKCQHINISLDSLRQDRFNAITKTENFEKVYKAVIMTKEMGFHIKVNVVIMRGVNDDEVLDFIEFSACHGIEVRFLELMKIGPYQKVHKHVFVPAQEMIACIEKEEVLFPQSVNCDSTSFNFRTSSGAQIGFIASESQSFCGFCSRLRLTATGHLRACVMSEAGTNLRGKDRSEYPLLLKQVMALKPIDRIDSIAQPMYQIGG